MDLEQFDEIYDIEDEDDLDLIKLVTTNANDTIQYLVFMGSDGNYFAMNVSKIEELVLFKEIDLVKNKEQTLVYATGDIRGAMTPLVRFDEWYGNPLLEDDAYELVIICSFGGHRFGLIVKDVEYIANIESHEMVDNSENNPKTSFITKVRIGRKDELCLVFDSDKMLIDVFENMQKESQEDLRQIERIESSKKVLFCDDSKFIRKLVGDLFQKMGISFRNFVNGAELLEYLQQQPKEEIGLIVTDLEMPQMSGRELINEIAKRPELGGIPIVVHTNMANDIAKEDLMALANVVDVIDKVDMKELSQSIKEHILR